MLKVCLQIQISRNLQTSWANNSKILRIKNAKFSGHCLYMNRNILGDFQICISVPLMLARSRIEENESLISLFLENIT